MTKFSVYRKNSNGQIVWIADTRYLQDAQHILRQWFAGYVVTDEGRMVEERNM